MNDDLLDKAMKRILELEKKINMLFETLKIENELDFILNGGYIIESDIDKIMSGAYLGENDE